MGFLAPAAPFIPMLVGAGAGALIDKDNPLRGAMLGAVGGSALGPAVAGLGGAGAAASEAAMAQGLGAEAAQSAAQAAAAQGITGMAVESPAYNAILGEQLAGMGTEGMKHYLGGAGVGNFGQTMASMATMGPQGVIENMGIKGSNMFSPKSALRMAGNMIQGQQQPQPMPAPRAAASMPQNSPAPPFQPVSKFVTGMPSMSKRKEQEDRFWGYS